MQPPIEQLLKAAEAQKDCCLDYVNKTELAIHRCVKAEEVADKHNRELQVLVRSAEIPLKETEHNLQVKRIMIPLYRLLEVKSRII
jgi:hypothetical protein